jgi:hypothetical protein
VCISCPKLEELFVVIDYSEMVYFPSYSGYPFTY